MRGTLLLLTSILICLVPGKLLAVSDELLIIEVQTESADSATEETIVIRNNSSIDISLDGKVVQYKSASGSSWSTRAELSGDIQSLEELNLTVLEESLKSGMSSSGGHVRIYDQINELEHDLLGWGTASEPLIAAAEAHEKGGRLVRKTNEEGSLVNTKNNSHDFYADNPLVDPELPVDPYEIIGVSNQPHELSGSLERLTLQNTIFPEIHVTELMPDPVSPLKDADDEFIEIYNPNNQAINISGYSLKTTSSNKSFILPEYILQPYQYLAIYSEDSELTLSNSKGTSVQVLAPNTKIVFETEVYVKAESSQSFMLANDGVWYWTKNVTPSKQNIYDPDIKEESSSGAQPIGDTGEVKGVLDSEPRNYDQFAARDVYQEPNELSSSSANFAILAGVGSLTIVYAIIEYRHDIRNTIYKLRRNRSSGS